MSVVSLATPPTASARMRDQAVEILREMLADAERGEVEALILIARHPDGRCRNRATEILGFCDMLGRLELMKHDLLKAFAGEG